MSRGLTKRLKTMLLAIGRPEYAADFRRAVERFARLARNPTRPLLALWHGAGRFVERDAFGREAFQHVCHTAEVAPAVNLSGKGRDGQHVEVRQRRRSGEHG